MNKENVENNTTKLHLAYISIIVLILLAMLASFYFYHKKIEKARVAMMASGVRQGYRLGNGKGMPPGGMMMLQLTPPPLSDQQTQQLTIGKSTATVQKTFNITGGNFYFVPNKITVNKGDQVTFVMTNAGGVHDLVIDELGVKTPVIHTSQAETAVFTASKAGSFIFYCSVSGHREKGMSGTLIVQ